MPVPHVLQQRFPFGVTPLVPAIHAVKEQLDAAHVSLGADPDKGDVQLVRLVRELETDVNVPTAVFGPFRLRIVELDQRSLPLSIVE
jgi:hypothetical protein